MKTRKVQNSNREASRGRSIFRAVESRVTWLILILVIPSVAQETRSSSRLYEWGARRQVRAEASFTTAAGRDRRPGTTRVDSSSPRNTENPENRGANFAEASNGQMVFEWMESSSFPIGSVKP
jgi:hypothetical protein